MGLEGIYLNIIKAVYDKPTASIILNGQVQQAFPLRLGKRLGCLLLCLIRHNTGSPSHSNQNKIHPNGKGRSKTVIICKWYDIVHKKHYRFHQKTT